MPASAGPARNIDAIRIGTAGEGYPSFRNLGCDRARSARPLNGARSTLNHVDDRDPAARSRGPGLRWLPCQRRPIQPVSAQCPFGTHVALRPPRPHARARGGRRPGRPARVVVARRAARRASATGGARAEPYAASSPRQTTADEPVFHVPLIPAGDGARRPGRDRHDDRAPRQPPFRVRRGMAIGRQIITNADCSPLYNATNRGRCADEVLVATQALDPHVSDAGGA